LNTYATYYITGDFVCQPLFFYLGDFLAKQRVNWQRNRLFFPDLSAVIKKQFDSGRGIVNFVEVL
jgi:hypothetical protein